MAISCSPPFRHDPLTFEREERALESAEKELGIKGKIIDWKSYLKHVTENK